MKVVEIYFENCVRLFFVKSLVGCHYSLNSSINLEAQLSAVGRAQWANYIFKSQTCFESVKKILLFASRNNLLKITTRIFNLQSNQFNLRLSSRNLSRVSLKTATFCDISHGH